MDSPYRISIIIPVFNRQQLGERALRSVICQDVHDMEIIVLDDASCPPFVLPQDLRSHPSIRLIRAEQNGGESAARNAAVAAARSNWIAFLDSDDFWLPGTLKPRLEAAQARFDKDPNPLTVQVAGFIVNNIRLGRQERRIPRPPAGLDWFASGCWFCAGSTSLLRREAFDSVGPCDTALHRLQDMDWYLRFALAGGRIEVWPGTVAVIETGSKAGLAVLENAITHMRGKYGPPGSPHHLPRPLFRKMMAYFDVERASLFAARGDLVRAGLCLGRSFLRQPRTQMHLERFWQRGDVSQRLDAQAT
jgi:GT2 family glycosyltransferase